MGLLAKLAGANAAKSPFERIAGARPSEDDDATERDIDRGMASLLETATAEKSAADQIRGLTLPASVAAQVGKTPEIRDAEQRATIERAQAEYRAEVERLKAEREADPMQFELHALPIVVRGQLHADIYERPWNALDESERREFGEEHGIYARNCDDEDEYRELLEQARNAELRAMNAGSRRLYDAITYGNGTDFDRSRKRLPCPVCEPSAELMFDPSGALVLLLDTFSASGRCVNGCSPYEIGAALSKRVADYESERTTASKAAEKKMMIRRVAALVKPSIKWIVDGFAPASATTIFGGVSGSMKTWVMLGLATAIASGKPFLGRATKRSRALVVVLEAKRINLPRLAYLAAGMGADFEALIADEWLHVYEQPLKSDDPASMESLAAYVREHQIDVVLIDNLTALRSSRTQHAENSADVMSATLEPLAELAHDGTVGGGATSVGVRPAIWVLHHAKDNGELRGSGAIEQHCDLVLIAERKSQREPESPILVRSGDGCRLMPAGIPCKLRFRGDMLRGEAVAAEPVDDERAPRSAPAPADADPSDLTPRQRMIVAIARENPGVGINAVLREIEARGGGCPSKPSVGKDLARLVADQMLREDENKKFFADDAD